MKPARVVHQRHLCTMSTGNSALLRNERGSAGTSAKPQSCGFNPMMSNFVGVFDGPLVI